MLTKKTNMSYLFIFSLLSLIVSNQSVRAETAQPEQLKVFDIMKRVDDFYDGDDFTATIKMDLIDRYGNERNFEMYQIRKYETTARDNRLTRSYFIYPEALEGVAVLAYDYKDVDKADDRWIYIPGVESVKQITSTEAGKLMGSDISYSDLNTRKTEDYDYTLLSSKKVGSWDTWEIQYVPKTQKVIDRFGYTKGVVYVDKKSYLVVRAAFWVAEKQKTMKFYMLSTMKEIEGIWTPVKMSFVTKRAGETLHRTNMELNAVRYSKKLNVKDFSKIELVNPLPKGAYVVQDTNQ